MYDNLETAHERGADERRLQAGMTEWLAAMDGRKPLSSALSDLCEAFGADAAGLSRYGFEQGVKPRLVAFDKAPANSYLPRLTRAYTHCVLGEFARRARPGTVWQSSMVADLDPALTSFQKRRALGELLVCPVGAGPDGHDYLEMHFISPVARHMVARIEHEGQLLHRAWQHRTAGDFFERIVSKTPCAGPDHSVDPLALDNPYRLSRAEFRVCRLLGQGLSNKAVATELGITAATLRTHLRNIYGKAGVENKAELVFRLLAMPRVPAGGGRITA